MSNLTFYEVNEGEYIKLNFVLSIHKIGDAEIKFCMIDKIHYIKSYECTYFRDCEMYHIKSLFKQGDI